MRYLVLQLHAIDRSHTHAFMFTSAFSYSIYTLLSLTISTCYCYFSCSGFYYSLFYIPFLLLRQSWGPRLDLHDPRFLALAAEHRLLQAEYDDYAAANSNGIACCRAVALMVSSMLPL